VNQNGVQDSGEPGVSGVKVTLYDATTDTPVATDVTNSSGDYLFDRLLEGNYYVNFDLDTLPAGHVATQPDATNNQQPATSDQTDSDGDPVTGLSPATGFLSNGQSDRTLDLGVVELPTVRIGDQVWEDLDGDGVQAPSEPGVAGIGVALYDANTGTLMIDGAGNPMTAVTDSAGNYLFEGLPAGQYSVIFDLATLPPGYMVTAPNQTVNDAADSDADPVTGQTMPSAILINGEEDMSLDMGILQPVSVGDRVWLDANGNGLQDSSESGVANVGVTLYDAVSGQPLVITTTDGAGNYLFENLQPGEYYVAFDSSTFPAGHMVTIPDATSDRLEDDQIDSDVDPNSGQTPSTGFLSSGQQDTSLDMGLVQPVSIGDRVWLDANINGVQDDGEAGVAGVGVTLHSQTTGETWTTITDANGNYLFAGLLPGGYSVTFDLATLPAEHGVTPPNIGDDTTDSDANPSTGQTGSTGFLAGGTVNNSLDMGVYPLEGEVQVGGQIWSDEDLDGTVDEEEPVLAGITVALYRASDPNTPIATQVTDETGSYFFDNLPPGEYITVLVPESLPEGAFAPLVQGGSENLRNTGELGENAQALNLNMPILFPGQLNGEAWLDQNGDGIQSADEAAMAGVTVRLYNEAGDVVAETVTNDDGTYRFDQLMPGLYQVEYIPADGYGLSPNLQGNDEAVNSDADPATRWTGTILVGSNSNVSHQDVGLYQGSSIGNQVWEDRNVNGIQDSDEPGLANVPIQLFTAESVLIDETTTDADGFYGFTDLLPGEYYMTFGVPLDLAALLRDNSYDATLNLGVVQSELFILAPGESLTNLDLRVAQPAAIGNYVWLDTDKDGLVDAEEGGLADVIVRLYDEDGLLVDEALTDSEGHYQFVVAPAAYLVEFVALGGMEFTLPNQGDDEVDSDANVETGVTELIVLAPGELNYTNFAGLIVSPTAIQLMSLAAVEIQQGVSIRWMTGAELSTFGFEIYRSRDGRFENATKVTNSIQLANGGEDIYEFIDTTAQSEQIYSYWLVEVQNDGRTYQYGPTRIITDAPSFSLFLPLIER